MRELGYVEGRDFTVTWHFGAGSDERLAALASEVVQAKPDVIFAWGTPAARASQAATRTIPIVIAGVADPVAFGLVASFANPGGNITGPSIMATDVAIKHLELLRAVVPAMSRVAVIFNPNNPIGPVALQQGCRPPPVRWVSRCCRSLPTTRRRSTRPLWRFRALAPMPLSLGPIHSSPAKRDALPTLRQRIACLQSIHSRRSSRPAA